MNVLELFAGNGGGILAGALLRHRCVCAVEVYEYARLALLARQNEGHLPAFPIWDDIRTFDGLQWRGIAEVVSGGFPCQAYSTAASGNNTADDLWPEMRRIVADVAPRYVFAENVSRRAINRAADDLEQMGYETRCIELSAQDLGADHIRGRCWLLAHAHHEGKLLREVDAEVAQLPGLQHRVWESYPDKSRMVDGVAHRVERLKTTGNGQVPIVAAAAWRLLDKWAQP